MYDAVERFTHQGGRLIYLGGNGFYWRIAYHQELPGVIEVRRAEGGSRAWEPLNGESYMGFTGEYGGLWRRQAKTGPNVIAGVGFASHGLDVSSPYKRNPDSFNPRASWIFEGVGKDEPIGDFGFIGGGAAGLEIDRVDPYYGSPPHVLNLASSQSHTDTYVLVVEDIFFNYPGTTGSENAAIRADLAFFETPNGGAVFSTGSIAWAGSMIWNECNNNVSRITENVVRRFLDKKPFV
jgi:N,N-dimethylformamidase